jgi:hypothetical protein
MRNYDGYSDNCKYSPSSDPALPNVAGQGGAAAANVEPNFAKPNSEGPAGLGELKNPNWTPGRGTRGSGTTHENID